jgi:exodeoxyribonuclease VII small subunit
MRRFSMAKKEETKFEDKIKELETIVNELESGEIDLETSIEKYTKAMKLVSECDEKLKNIEEQVNKIIKDNGEMEDFSIEE